MESLEIHTMTPGSYNLNFHISVDIKEFIFRVNIDQQSGLSRQVAYEYNALKFLEGRGLAPDVYHLDDTRQHFEFDILIEQYLEGPHLLLDKPHNASCRLAGKTSFCGSSWRQLYFLAEPSPGYL